MSTKLITLERWLADTYGDDAPTLDTARRWIKAGKVHPKPEKHGRSYYVHPEARYTDRPPEPGDPASLLDRVRASEAKALAH